MKYLNTVHAGFEERINRFVARVSIDGKSETVHVKNTGRCKELLLPGSEVILCKADNPNRKTLYDLIAVYKTGLGWVNIDSQAPNQVVKEWLQSGHHPFGAVTTIKPEYTLGKSRMDFYMENNDSRILMEVKGCTLEIDGIGYFPDAPTERGIKHLNELVASVSQGYVSYLAFVIAMPGVYSVLPNMSTHPEFGAALNRAKDAGVKILYLPCEVGSDYLKILEYSDPVKKYTPPKGEY